MGRIRRWESEEDVRLRMDGNMVVVRARTRTGLPNGLHVDAVRGSVLRHGEIGGRG